jgi:hypothetical protein
MGRRAKLNSKKRNRRVVLLAALAVAIVAIVAFAVLVSNTFNTPYASYLYKPIPTTLYQQITGVSDSTLAAVGSPSSVAPPTTISGTPLILNGKPEILYVGAEYCPYCAVERWAMILALSKFGTFSNIDYMVSSSTDVNANTPTFTFSSKNFSYTSQYVTFVPVEEYNRTAETTVWHSLTTQEEDVYSQYGTGGFPFIDLANQFLVNGVQTTIDIGGQNWTQVASQLTNPSSSTAIGIDGAANKLISAICNIDGDAPSSVCTQSYATIALAYTPGTGGSTSLAASSLLSVTPMRESTRWTI